MSSRHRIIPVLFVALAVFAFSYRQLSDPDLGFHLRYGQWIVENGMAPDEDVTTYTSTGNTYTDMHWLFQVMLYGIYRLVGYTGISLLVCLLNLVFFIVLAIRNRKHNIPPFLSALLLLVFLLIIEQRIAPRPEMVSYLLLITLFLILDGYSAGKQKLLPLLPLIMLIWCNFHALYILGIIVIVIAFLVNWTASGKPDLRFAGWSLISVVACLVNPYGWHGFTFPFFLLTRFDPTNIYNRHILEFMPFFSQSTFYTRDYLFLILAGATIAFIVLYFRRLPLFYIVIALLFLPLGIISVRNTPLFAMAAIPLAGRSIMMFYKPDNRIAAFAEKICAPLLMTVSLFLTGVVLTDGWYRLNNSINRTGTGLNEDQLPVRAAAFINSRNLDGRILNSLGYGGWFSWTLTQPVFIDGRLEVMPSTLYRQVVESWKGGLPDLIEKYKPVIIAYNYLRYYPWTTQLRHMPDWRLVYADGQSAIFLHSSYRPELSFTPLSEIAGNQYSSGHGYFWRLATNKIQHETDSLHLTMLFNQLGLESGRFDHHEKAVGFFNHANESYHRGDIRKAKMLYDSAIMMDPGYVKALNNRAILRASGLNDFQGALSDFNRAISLNPEGSDAYLGRGTVYMLMHDTASACFDWQKAASMGNDRAMRLVHMHCNRK